MTSLEAEWGSLVDSLAQIENMGILYVLKKCGTTLYEMDMKEKQFLVQLLIRMPTVYSQPWDLHHPLYPLLQSIPNGVSSATQWARIYSGSARVQCWHLNGALHGVDSRAGNRCGISFDPGSLFGRYFHSNLVWINSRRFEEWHSLAFQAIDKVIYQWKLQYSLYDQSEMHASHNRNTAHSGRSILMRYETAPDRFRI